MKAILGIDISKNKFDVCLLFNNQTAQGVFKNNLDGFEQLQKWLAKRPFTQLTAGMEATGRYWEALAHYMYALNHQVVVLNPKIIKKYGESKLQRNKTDRLDAQLIAEYVSKEQPYLWQPPAPERADLKALTRHLNDLIETKSQQLNRLQAGTHPAFVLKSIEDTIKFLKQQIDETEAAIEQLLKQNAVLLTQHQQLLSIPGIGFRSASVILAEIPDIHRFQSPKQLTAYAGLTPQQLQSGQSYRASGMIKLGNRHLRKALYFPALVGLQHNSILIAYAEKLQAKGKHKMTVVGALMRKLLHLIFGILKNRSFFDPNYLVNVRHTA